MSCVMELEELQDGQSSGEESEIDTSVQDNDSALGVEDDFDSTVSMTATLLRSREENGRTYNGYGLSAYILPNDEHQMDRLDLQHHLLQLTFGGQLMVCPINEERTVHRVLDVGTGTGIWAIDYAEEHPETVVIGVDVSPIQPLFVPPNVQFEIDDLEQTWSFTKKFDYIHSRMLTGSFTNWPRFIQQSYQHLNRGGYLEIQDVSFPIRSDDSSLPRDSALYKWSSLMLEASTNLGCPLNTAENCKRMLEEQGFVDVVEKVFQWPMNRWPEDKKLKEIGLWTLENFTSSLSGISHALFTSGLGWSAENLELFLVDVRKDMKNLKYHAYWPIYAIYGRKPEDVASGWNIE